jgi:hypothetical protein
MKIDGRCHCGNITFEAEVDPATVAICHCADCQTLSGTAFRTIVKTRERSFRFLSGAPKVYVTTAESGNTREHTFCPNCGTSIYSRLVAESSTMVSLRVGAIRQRDQMVPIEQYWFRSSQTWLSALPTIQRRETQPVVDPRGGCSSS